jgi:tetratricopeptide (TPR) repeat protein
MFRKRQGSSASPALQDDLRVATEAAARGQWAHSLTHLARALADDPANPQALALLERVLKSTRDPLRYVPLAREGETPYQVVGLRAYIHAWCGQLDEAVSLIRQIYGAVPGTPFSPWLVEWLASPNSTGKVQPQTITTFTAVLIAKFRSDSPGAVRELTEQLRPYLVRFCQAYPRENQLAGMTSILVRKLVGRVDEAMAIARAAYQACPGYWPAVALAGACRDKGDLPGAIQACRAALKHDPSDLHVRLDLGDLLSNTWQIAEGLEFYRQVLDREPEHPWAFPSYLYYRHQLDPAGAWGDQLEQYATQHPQNERAAKLVEQLDPYDRSLPGPADATINLLRQAADQKADIHQFEIELSSLESPSARLAVELYQIECYGRANLTVRIGQIQQPDPRLPRGAVDRVLWRYSGTDPQPAVGPPSRGTAQAVAVLAARPFRAQDWWDMAGQIAAKLRPKSQDLLGVMIHPPRRPDQFPVWLWLHRVQVASAFLLGRLDSGWQDSERKRVLFSLARGPMDWSVEAAIIALAQLALHEPTTVPDIANLYLELLNSLPSTGGVPYLHALSVCSARLPSAPQELQQALDEWSTPDESPALAGQYLQSGLAHFRKKEYNQALAEFDQAIRLNSELTDAYYHRAETYLKKDNLKAAIADYDQVIRLDPGRVGAYVNRGMARGREEDGEGAMADFTEAIRLDPQVATAYMNRGVEHSKRGEDAQAVADYTSAIRLDPRVAMAYSNRAAALIELRDYERAITDCSQAIRLDPSYAPAYNNRAYAHLKKDEYDAAIADCDVAIRLRPHGYFYNNRGQARGAKGDYAGAVADLQQALRLTPNHPEAQEIRAKIDQWRAKP